MVHSSPVKMKMTGYNTCTNFHDGPPGNFECGCKMFPTIHWLNFAPTYEIPRGISYPGLEFPNGPPGSFATGYAIPRQSTREFRTRIRISSMVHQGALHPRTCTVLPQKLRDRRLLDCDTSISSPAGEGGPLLLPADPGSSPLRPRDGIHSQRPQASESVNR